MNKLYYLNIKELKQLCFYLKIPYYFFYKIDNKLIKLSYNLSKKDIVLRLKKYIKNKNNQDIYKPVIVSDKMFANKPISNKLSENDNLYIDQYKNGNKNIYNLLSNLTNNKFKYGAISCYLIRKIMMNNKLITYKKFAKIYLKLLDQNIEHPEWMYINYDGDNWHYDRNKIAKKIIKYLSANNSRYKGK